MKPPERTVTGEDVARHEGIIRVLARRLALNVDMIEDLEQEGRIGAWRALQKFDPARGVTEGTYVGVWAKGAMRRYLRDKADMIRYPAYVQEQGILSQRVLSLDDMSRQRHDERGADYVVPDPNADTEDAALAREELDRVIHRAHLTPLQTEALMFWVLGDERPVGKQKALDSRKREADRKIEIAKALAA